MTVIDQVLTAEKAAETTLAEAREAAAANIAAAKKAQAEALLSEKARLSETEKTELAANQTKVDASAEKIVHDAQVKVQTIEHKFAQKSADIVKKIKASLS